ncbi:ExbD/TolR family protein [Shewanella frigidimarina]|jgi:biopolymer transport protein ExbD|uniref:ExbD/TolR family protein n=1 Tax=Shewanella frigidimarina TaxID=56812 RepID=UPI003D7B5F15|tara:strand:+ start:5272 stop:5805 length:534 start_codon:yes stop_codon:yes gene_type:complete
MMKQSARSRRLAKHHKRLKAGSKLNLVALMDIFTILVFFLIVNQSEVRVLQNIEKISLPVSVADVLPVENLVITVFTDTVLVQERPIWQKGTDEIGLTEQQNPEFINALTNELTYQASKRTELSEAELQNGRAVTIIGDASTPYVVLKQIMTACAATGYRDISLAVEQQAKQTNGEG